MSLFYFCGKLKTGSDFMFDISINQMIALLVIASIVGVRTDENGTEPSTDFSDSDFCQAFRDNNGNVFFFRRNFKLGDLKNPKHNIVIKDKYWTVEYNENSDSLKMVGKKSNPSPIFGSEGLIGAVFLSSPTSFGPKEDYQTLLVFKAKVAPSTILVEGANIVNDDLTDPLAMDYQRNDTFVINDLPATQSPDIVFSGNQIDQMYVVNINADNKLTAERFTFLWRKHKFEFADTMKASDFESFSTDYRVIAISSQTASNEGFLLLLKDEDQDVIYWCWLASMRTCTPKKFKNCKLENKYHLIWVSAIVLIIVCVIAVALICLCYCSRRPTTKGSTTESEVSKSKDQPKGGQKGTALSGGQKKPSDETLRSDIN